LETVKNPLKQIAGFNKVVRSVQAFGRALKRQADELNPQAHVEPTPQTLRPPKIGLALGGGFARGLAHIGVLKVFEQERIPIDFIAGTSVGAVIGASYASGLSAQELCEIAGLVRFKDFSRWAISRFGLFSNDRMLPFLRKILRCKTFEELRIPFAVTATDIRTGEAVVFTSGDLAGPVRASCAYPGMFQPVEIGGRLLVDGLLAHAVPAAPLREMGAERVVSVHLPAAWVKADGPRHVFDIIGQCFSIAQDRMGGLWRSISDLVMEPEIGNFAYDDFERAPELIQAGEIAARAVVPKIREWFPFAQPDASLLEPAKALTPVELPVTAK
jgi:NTE family protein